MNSRLIKSFLLFIISGKITIVNSQSIAPQSINAGGSTMTQVNGSLSFTVGELVVISQTDIEGNTLSNGFNAGAVLTTVSINETDDAVLDVNVYPNPTMELVNVKINHSTIDNLILTIVDIQGKEIYNGKYASISNVIGINTASYSKGTYIMSLKSTNNEILGIYKIIKN